MTQIATVERILDDTHAEISVPRKSACGHDCEECAGCGVSGVSVYVKALNTVGARPGQKVVVESDTKKMLKIVSFVYLIPVILFLAGYLIMLACSTSVAVQYTAAVAGAVLGILLAIWYDRRVKARGGLSLPSCGCSDVRICAALRPGSAGGGTGPVPRHVLRTVPHPVPAVRTSCPLHPELRFYLSCHPAVRWDGRGAREPGGAIPVRSKNGPF